jgi:phosphoglycolate phosphatase
LTGRRSQNRKGEIKTAAFSGPAERLGESPVPCRAAVFDLDGTLADTLEDLARSCNQALASAGFPVHPVESYRRFVGDGVYKLVERALPSGHRGAEECEAVKAAFDRYYAEGYLTSSRPYPGIPSLLDALAEAGVRLCVVSNKPHPFAVRMAEALFPGRFSVVFGNRPGVAKKPDPAAVWEALERVNVLPEQAVYIGDSDVDVLTGHRAGLWVIGCLWGFRGEEELRAAGADKLVQSADEIRRLLL